MKSKPIIFIDYQHVGKPSPRKVGDRGAGVDIDDDGKIAADEREAYWTRLIGLVIEDKFPCLMDGTQTGTTELMSMLNCIEVEGRYILQCTSMPVVETTLPFSISLTHLVEKNLLNTYLKP